MKKQEPLLRIQSETAESARTAAKLFDQIRSSSDLQNLAEICIREKEPLKRQLAIQVKACFLLTKKHSIPFDLARELIEDCIDDVSASNQKAVEQKLSATLEYASRMLWDLHKSNNFALKRWNETEYQCAFNYIIGI
jgi:Ribonuclease G/E